MKQTVSDTMPDLLPTRWILDAVADPGTGWSVGTFGAIAEFVRDPDEPTTVRHDDSGASAATTRGGIRIRLDDRIRPVPYETPGKSPESWNHAVALCLPVAACEMGRRTEVTELGPDGRALRPQDRDGILFDLGLACLQVDICVRTADPTLIAALRRADGRPLFAPDNGAMAAILAASPHRVFRSRIGRAEVYQAIPAAEGRSPDGPHTHLLPKLMRSGRTHAATTPIPDGFVPCAHLFPPHPTKDHRGHARPFDHAAHRAFQDLFRRFADPHFVVARDATTAAIAAGRPPGDADGPADKHVRASQRVTLRQGRAAGDTSLGLSAWISALDPHRSDIDDDEQPSHDG